ncbi:MAG: glutamate synthase [Isosphaeraceae bacterium]
MPNPPTDGQAAEIPVNEVRDYRRINAEVVRLLDAGQPRIVLQRVERQRLLLEGLRGPWSAFIEVEGRAGPELAAGLDAPGLCIRAAGADDGAARGLRAGALRIDGEAGDGLAYELEGGIVIALGAAGHRAGLRMRGGVLVVAGAVGRLPGDRQRGGWIVAPGGAGSPGAGHGRVGGKWITSPSGWPDAIRAALLGLPAGFLPADRFRPGFDGLGGS